MDNINQNQPETDGLVSPTKVRKPRRKSGGVLTSPAGMGGLDSGGGHDFQARYIVCHLPEWLGQPGFKEIFHEGTGDVDIRYSDLHGENRHHIQVKNYDGGLKLADFQKVLDGFDFYDRKMPDVYQRFTIACPSIHADLQPLQRFLERVRKGKPFYDTKPVALESDRQELQLRVQQLGLEKHLRLLEEKVHFHVGLHDMGNDSSCRDLFAGSLNRQPIYRDRLATAAAQSAYMALFTSVRGGIGTVMNRVTLESIIDGAARGEKPLGEPAVHLVIHNWTKEKFDLHSDPVLDWSAHFDLHATPRRVPSADVWRSDLLPDLRKTRDVLRANATRLIRFRGKCCLSTGIALGQTFSQRGDWRFEILQTMPGQPEPVIWRSDVAVRRDYPLGARQATSDETLNLDGSSDAIAVVVNVRRDSRNNAKTYLSQHSVSVKAFYEIEPADGTGDLSVADAEEALSIALAVRRVMDCAQDEHGSQTIHLFFNGPFALSVFLGQQLNVLGAVQLYEFLQSAGYVPSCLLQT